MVSMKNTKSTFLLVGNNLAMDFINTELASQEGSINLLAIEQDVHDWAEQVGIHLSKENNALDMAAIWSLRTALRTLMVNQMDQQTWSAEAMAELNIWLPLAPHQQQLRFADGQLALQPLSEALTSEQLLGKIAQAGAELLTSPLSAQIKRCSNEKCILMFVDTSRSRKRRWCSMEYCGNRAKAANFYHANKS